MNGIEIGTIINHVRYGEYERVPAGWTAGYNKDMMTAVFNGERTYSFPTRQPMQSIIEDSAEGNTLVAVFTDERRTIPKWWGEKSGTVVRAIDGSGREWLRTATQLREIM